MNISVIRVGAEMSSDVAVMTGELLDEIMAAINSRAFNFVLSDAAERIKKYIDQEKYFVFAAMDKALDDRLVGFVSLYESVSIYAEGEFGTIPELYVRPAYRQRKVGKTLLETARKFGERRGWTRLEVTTPPIPQFQRTLEFYEREGFAISGGRKLQAAL